MHLNRTNENIIQTLRKASHLRNSIEIDALIKFTSQIPLFQSYIEQKLDQIHKKCCELMKLESFSKDQIVYHIDSFSQKFFVVLDGKVGVYTKIKDQNEQNNSNDSLDYKISERHNKKSKKLLQFVKELGPGSSFGELDLEGDKPREETIKCLSDCSFAILNKREFQTLIRQFEEEKLLKEMGFFAKLPIFQGWYFTKIRDIYQSTIKMKLKKNSIVFKEGQICQYVYIIAQGDFVAKMKFEQYSGINDILVEDQKSIYKNEFSSKKDLKISVLSYPEMFGEEDIIKQQNRSYSVICESSEGCLLAISKEDFINKIMIDSNSNQFIMQRMENKSSNTTNRVQNIENLLSQYSNFVIDDKSNKSKERESFSSQVNNNQRRSTFITYSQSNSFMIPENKQKENIPIRFPSPNKSKNEVSEDQNEIALPKNEYFLQEIQQFNQFGYNESFEEENPMIPTSPIRDKKKKRTINLDQLQRPGSIHLLIEQDNINNQQEQVSPINKQRLYKSQSQSFMNLQPTTNQATTDKYIFKLKENYQSSLQQKLSVEKALEQQQEMVSSKKQRLRESLTKDPLSEGFKKQLQIRFFNQFRETSLKSLQDHIPQQIVQETPKNINENSLTKYRIDLMKNNKIIIPYSGKSGVKNYLRDMQKKVDEKLKKENENTPQSSDNKEQEFTNNNKRSKSVFFERNKDQSVNQIQNIMLGKIINNYMEKTQQSQGNQNDQRVLKFKMTQNSKQNSCSDQRPNQNQISNQDSLQKMQADSRKSSISNMSNTQKQINISTVMEFKIKKQDITPHKLGSKATSTRSIQSSLSQFSQITPIHNMNLKINQRDVSPLIKRIKQSQLLPLTQSSIITKQNLIQEYQKNSYHISTHIKIQQAPTQTITNLSQSENQSQSNINNQYSVQSFTDCLEGVRSKSLNNLSKIQNNSSVKMNTFAKISPNLSPSKRKNIQQMPLYKFQIHQQANNRCQSENQDNINNLGKQINIQNNFIISSKAKYTNQN
ncbi:cyclic nucleotide-binding domain protein (macronuclear) [Tetrahymena thermophila SB210]|uniref:Cyclic nucleotide-binding domain protein n=1 Tax=Tetrahymena thermophila (strain SB210) TaxID=312017 RepID=Q22Y21_TETTS|nr:cyclic nucleotide-binding domain protein [Tetrahymena thermophila SB210]EAR90203.2 cyclic nucleotide-binding domain protein [Tetrahymena thermophila SB210]|eukprot:XP_001010448.2 cyclic nucleotide-binding domain protein [Tetrahymena thermophila SB210]